MTPAILCRGHADGSGCQAMFSPSWTALDAYATMIAGGPPPDTAEVPSVYFCAACFMPGMSPRDEYAALGIPWPVPSA